MLVLLVIYFSLAPAPVIMLPMREGDKFAHAFAYFVLMSWFANLYPGLSVRAVCRRICRAGDRSGIRSAVDRVSVIRGDRYDSRRLWRSDRVGNRSAPMRCPRDQEHSDLESGLMIVSDLVLSGASARQRAANLAGGT